MKRFYLKWGHVFAAFVLVMASSAVNAACAMNFYQDEVPDKVKKMRKF